MLAVCKSKDNLTMREQQILWDNYHLGKRIIEASPVICKRRLDEDYRKHKKLVKGLMSSSSNKMMPTEFRVKSKNSSMQNYKSLKKMLSIWGKIER